MKKTCFMFPGQGSQKPGMGISLNNCSKHAQEVFDCANSVFSTNILNLCSNETNYPKLLQTEFAQPAIVTVSIAAFKATVGLGATFQAVVGHSLGSISALIASEVVSMEDGFKIVMARANAMKKCELESNGAMCAVVGAKPEDVKTACQNASDYVICANFNGLNQVVISGKPNAINEVKKNLESKSVRCIMLKVKAAFHSKLMQPAADSFKSAIESIKFNTPKVPIFSNVTGKKIEHTDNIKQILVNQITSPVNFTENLLELEKAGFEQFVELGPSRPLSSMVKSTLKSAKLFNVCDEKSLNITLQNLS